jgi:hypothetical protein
VVFFGSGDIDTAGISMKFNWAEMKREQKQAVILISLWVFGGVFALYQFVLSPYLRDKSQSTGELEKLSEQIKRAEVAMMGEPKVRADYRAAMAEYQAMASTYIAPAENPLAWAQDKIYRVAREVGVSITSVSAAGAPAQVWDNLVKKERIYKPYTIRVIAECGYADLVALIAALEDTNPFLAVTGIIVSGQDQSRVRHGITLTIEMPMVGRPPMFQTLGQKAKAGSTESAAQEAPATSE